MSYFNMLQVVVTQSTFLWILLFIFPTSIHTYTLSTNKIVLSSSHYNSLHQSSSSLSILSNFPTKTRINTKLNSSFNDEFIDNILSPPSDSPSYRCTHMIGVPLEQNHDLLLELESVQRGILYHCPFLIHSCITPVVTRMPLLLVDTKASGTSSAVASAAENQININDWFQSRNVGAVNTDNVSSPGENDLLTSRDPITRTLHDIVNTVVKEMIYVQVESAAAAAADDDDSDDNDSDDNGRNGLNQDKNQPLIMTFKGLEIDGDQNEILHAIGDENEGTILMRNVLNEITNRIEQKGWKVYMPEDNPQGKQGGLNEDGITWRPRIPFMRLPSDFFETLPDPQGFDGQWKNYSDEQKKMYMRLPEEGGNGISPIFWYKWWDDKLCNGKGIRIRELAVYGRTAPMGTTEKAFYIPHLRTKLPDGSEVMLQDEAKDRAYDNERRMEQEMLMDRSENAPPLIDSFEKEMAKQKSKADRRMLETIYDSSPDVSDAIDIDKTISIDEKQRIEGLQRIEDLLDAIESAETIGIDEQRKIEELMDAIDITETIGIDKKRKLKELIKDSSIPLDKKKQDELSNNDPVHLSSDRTTDQKKEEIIRSIEKPMATGDWTKLPNKNKPKPEDNPILKNWKKKLEGSSPIPGKANANKKRKLPPYPSDEHFVGIWRLQSTPGGPSIDEQRLMGVMGIDPDVSENIVLRVDGTTAGGPILDVENQHRAAGGTWKFFQAQWVGSSTSDNNTKPDESLLQTRLRIRLLIPPSKDKVLVLEGEVNRGGFVTPETISQDNVEQLRKTSSFGMNVLMEGNEQRATKPNISDDEQAFLQCSGEMWVETSAGGKKKRSKLGQFSLIKHEERDPSQYQYTILPPQRYQD